MSLTKVLDTEYFRERLCRGVRAKFYAEMDDFISSCTADFELRQALRESYVETVEDFCKRLDVELHTSFDIETQRKNFTITLLLHDEPVETEEVDEKSSV